MSTIIAGLYGHLAPAEEAISHLQHAGVSPTDITMFALNSPGQHDRYPIGGDSDESPGARQADSGATAGAVLGGVAGIAAGAVAAAAVGPLAIPLVAGVGAYTGSLVGGLNATDDGPIREEEYLRTAGTMVAVNASSSDVAVETIARILKESGALEVERAEGQWANGAWSDFDPLRPPQRVDVPPPVPGSRTSAPPAR